ncbi:MAG: hypothetical protein ABR936_11910 [Bacteroidota bacterium]|jgi:hypothetical protein
MIIKPSVNNKVIGFSITDDVGDYFFPEATEALALEKYNAAKAVEAAPPTYSELRKAAYPLIADQLDMIYNDKINGTTIWVDTITAIKIKYPAPKT